MKIGMIGLGFMGATHYQALSGIEGVSVAAVCSNNPEALAGDLTRVGGNIGNAAAKYDFSQMRKYRDWHALIADPDLDAVDICLPTDLHLPVTVEALSSGKHVICEKPMALSGDECDQMAEAARRRQRVLMIGQVLRFWDSYRFLHNFISGGEYGSVRRATFFRRSSVPDWSKWLVDDSRSGGALLDLLVHDIDQALSIFGVPDRVAAKSLGDFDTVSATLIYPGGPEVRVQGGWFPSGTPFAMGFQVSAEKGELELGPDGLRINDQFGASAPVKVEGPGAYDLEMRYFIDCCRSGQPPAECPPEASAQAVKLALAMKESRAKGGEQIKCGF